MQDLISVENKDYGTKRAAWFKIIEDYSASGESQVNYCKQRGIKMDHFAYYLGRWRKANTTKIAAPSFVELQVLDTPHDKWLLNIGLGIKLEVPSCTSMQQLTELIINIRAKSC